MIAFADRESPAYARISCDIGVDAFILNTGSFRHNVRVLNNALHSFLQTPDGPESPKKRGHIVNETYWHDPVSEPGEYRRELCDLLEKLGIRRTLAGYRYLLSAVTVQALYSGPPKPKYLYEVVADYHGVTPLAVEKAIRYAIECAWVTGDIYAQHSLFGLSVDESRGKPTNAEFIARLAIEFKLSR